MKLKQGCSIYSDYGLNISAEEYAEDGVPIIRTSDVDNSGELDLSNTKYVEPHVVGTKRLRKGDVLFSRSGTIGRAMVFDADAEATYAAYLVRFRPHPKRLLSKYIGYWAQSAGYWHQIGADTIQSTIGNFNANKFANLSIPEHDLATQRQIADFLNRETARIDLLTEKKQRMLALLGEKLDRTVRAFLSGETDYPHEDQRFATGIRYLPSAPKHWSIEKIGWRYEIQLGKMLDSAKQTGEHLRRYLRVADVQWGKINTDDLPQMDFSPSDRKRFHLQRGDLLVNEGGSYVGRSAVWRSDDDEVYYQKALHRVRPRNPKRDSAEFLYYLMWFATKYGVFIAGGNQTTIDHLTAEAFSRYRFAFPTLDQQIRISERLKSEEVRHEEVSTKINASVDRLKEYRSALITAAVTGQIDVSTYTKSGTPDRRLDAIQEEMEDQWQEN